MSGFSPADSAPKPDLVACLKCDNWHPLAQSHVCIPTPEFTIQPITGTGRCVACGEVYARARGHLACQPMRQTTLFSTKKLRPVAWSLQWRWTKKSQADYAARGISVVTDWNPHERWQNIPHVLGLQRTLKEWRACEWTKDWRVRATMFEDEDGVVTVVP